jgi:hypothetical protein
MFDPRRSVAVDARGTVKNEYAGGDRMQILFLIFVAFAPNIACVIWLLSPWKRGLERQVLLWTGSLLPMLGGLIALPHFADPDGRSIALTPIALAGALLIILLFLNLANRASKAQHLFLGILALGTTFQLFLVLGWTASCAFGICV